MTLAIGSMGADEIPHRTLGCALACLPGLPQAARDALWGTDALKTWQEGWPVPGAPSTPTVFQLINFVTGNHATALGAAIDDPATLHRTVQSMRSKDFWKGAATNPYLRPDTSDWLATQANGMLLVGHRVDARKALASRSAGGATADDVADGLVTAREGILCAQLLASRADGTLSGFELDVADAVDKLLLNASWGAKAAQARATRRAALSELAKTHPASVTEFGFRLAENQYGVIDPGALDSVAAAINAGVVDPNSVQARLDADAAAWAELRTDGVAALIPEPTVVPLERKKALNPFAEKCIGTKAEWQALALLGMATASSRAALSSSEPLTDEELTEALEEADVETVVDWAEKCLPHKPAPGQVLDVLLSMEPDRASSVAAEVDLRGGATDANPELALCLPGAASRPIPAAAARAVRAHMQRAIGEDRDQWAVAATLIDDGWEGTLVDLAEAAVLTSIRADDCV